MANLPPGSFAAHPLPPAPQFVGRESELQELDAFWESGAAGVFAMVGLGGAGKTALASRFVANLIAPGREPKPAGLFVWSFYLEPDAGLFLETLHRHLQGETLAASPARGAGLLHLVQDALSAGGRFLLVLDGLERVQQEGGAEGKGHGRIEDPLLRALLTRIAEGAGRASVLVTSRFPLSDLEPQRGRGYRYLDVGGLERTSARDLLRRQGVRGDDAALDALVETYGAHALTLDHLGGLIGQFFDGDPSRAPEAPGLGAIGSDHQGRRLARILRAYEEHLPPAELALLCRLSLLRSSVAEDHLLQLFLCSPTVHARAAREAARLVGNLPDVQDHPFLEPIDLANAVRATLEEILCGPLLAGPTETFPRDVCQAVESVFSLQGEPLDGDLDAFLRLYANVLSDAPTDHRPLSEHDRVRLADVILLYRELGDHPALKKTKAQHHESLLKALEHLGWGAPGSYIPDDRTPDQLRSSLERLERRLGRLALKHVALLRVREVSRLRQRKYALAGPLANLEADGLRRTIAILVERHLVVREYDGTVGIHPAIRDHFARLGDAVGRGGWHDLIREQLVSLARRPGRGFPDDKATLDLVEEAIHHALEAGKEEDARNLYHFGLGGLSHLGWKLGEMARGLRILRGFRDCPDDSALGWFLRGLGELDDAYRANRMAFFRADVRLLQGRLPEVVAEGDPVRAETAAFLMGDRIKTPADVLGASVPRVQLLLLAGRIDQALSSPWLDRLYGNAGWEADKLRFHLLRAELARRTGDTENARRLLEGASGWILHSGSVEHLCLWHLVRSRCALGEGDLSSAIKAIDEGVRMARQSGLGLYHIMLLNARAETLLATDPASAESSAREAKTLASAPECTFRWGEAEADTLLGQALAALGRRDEALAAIRQAIAMRRRIGDPNVDELHRLMRQFR